MVKQRKGVKEELIMPIKNTDPKSNTPTPEQMRIAQILEKKVVDSTIKLKLKQIMDATQRSADEVYVALHDSDFDVNRAVNLLIEREDQLADWCTNEKRKKKLADFKDKKEEVVEAELPQPENKNAVSGRGDNKRRPGRRQDGGRQLQKPHVDEPRKQASFEPRAPRSRRPGFGSMVFERSNPPPIDTGLLPPVRNQWEKPLLKTNGPEDDWDCEEFQGSLSQTQIFTSSKRHEPQEILEELKTPKVISPRPASPLSSLTFTNKAHDPRDKGFVSSEKRDSMDIRPNIIPSQERSIVIPSQETPIVPSEDRSSIISSQDRPSVIPSQDRSTVTLPTETRADYVYRLNYAKPNHHEDKRLPSKIPTLPVEMPPELKPSLSFLDIQFGAIDLCSSETSSESQSNHSNAPSQNPSATTLMSPSSCSVTHLMANTSISSSSTNNVPSSVANTSANCSPLASTTCTNSSGICSITNPSGMNGITSSPGMNGMASSPGINSSTNPPGLSNISNSITNSGISSINTTLSTAVNQSLNSITNTALNSIASMSTSNSIPPVNMVSPSNISGSISHLMAQSSIQQAGTNMAPSNSIPNATHMVPNTINHTYGSTNTQSRFMPSSQAFNGSHLQYGIINPPVTSHGYESRDNAPPPHLSQPHAHLPPFKSPPGVPKGAMVPNLPSGPLVGNQYIVGQGNVPYFPHPPIYYYEEVPPVMNSQQRLTSMASHPHHYDVSYQSAPSSRDSVHYNV